MCGTGGKRAAKWKYEPQMDQRFEFVDIPSFVDRSCSARWAYFMLFLQVLRATLIYIADLWTIIQLAVFVSSNPKNKKSSLYSGVDMPIEYLRFIFWASILASYILLVVEIRKARRVIRHGDIALAYVNVLAYRYMSLVSYAHFCFFRQITLAQKGKDKVAFFVFFTLRSWKRFVFAESPRHVINGITLGWIFKHVIDDMYKKHNGHGSFKSFGESMSSYMDGDPVRWLSFGTITFTFVLYLISAFTMMAAALIYIPLVMSVRGNIKEYCCHKIDKRLAVILKKNRKKMLAKEQRKLATGGYGTNDYATTAATMTDTAGGNTLRQVGGATLPMVDVDLDDETINNMGSTGGGGGGGGGPLSIDVTLAKRGRVAAGLAGDIGELGTPVSGRGGAGNATSTMYPPLLSEKDDSIFSPTFMAVQHHGGRPSGSSRGGGVGTPTRRAGNLPDMGLDDDAEFTGRAPSHSQSVQSGSQFRYNQNAAPSTMYSDSVAMNDLSFDDSELRPPQPPHHFQMYSIGTNGSSSEQGSLHSVESGSNVRNQQNQQQLQNQQQSQPKQGYKPQTLQRHPAHQTSSTSSSAIPASATSTHDAAIYAAAESRARIIAGTRHGPTLPRIEPEWVDERSMLAPWDPTEKSFTGSIGSTGSAPAYPTQQFVQSPVPSQIPQRQHRPMLVTRTPPVATAGTPQSQSAHRALLTESPTAESFVTSGTQDPLQSEFGIDPPRTSTSSSVLPVQQQQSQQQSQQQQQQQQSPYGIRASTPTALRSSQTNLRYNFTADSFSSEMMQSTVQTTVSTGIEDIVAISMEASSRMSLATRTNTTMTTTTTTTTSGSGSHAPTSSSSSAALYNLSQMTEQMPPSLPFAQNESQQQSRRSSDYAYTPQIRAAAGRQSVMSTGSSTSGGGAFGTGRPSHDAVIDTALDSHDRYGYSSNPTSPTTPKGRRVVRRK